MKFQQYNCQKKNSMTTVNVTMCTGEITMVPLDEQLEVSIATEESRIKEFLYNSYGFPYDVYDKI